MGVKKEMEDKQQGKSHRQVKKRKYNYWFTLPILFGLF